MKVAICISGFIRTWEYSRPSFEKFFCNGIEADLYLHTYKQNLHEYSSRVSDTEYTEEEIKGMFKGLNVVKLIIEDLHETRKQVEKESSIYSQFTNFENKINESSDAGTKSINVGKRIYDQIRVIHVSNELRKEVGKTYDLVVKTRYDVLYYNTPDWKEMIDGKIHTEFGAVGGYPHEVVICGTPEAMEKGVMSRYSKLPELFFGSPIKGGNCSCGNIIPCCSMCAHATLRHLFDYSNLHIGSNCCRASVIRNKNDIHVPGIGTIPLNKYVHNI